MKMAVDVSLLGGQALQIIIVVITVLVLGTIVIVSLLLYLKWRKYQEYKCIIWEEDGFGQLNETYDTAGIFVDSKTKNKRFFMRKARVGLNPDSIPYLPSTRGKKKVYLLRTGLKNFTFIKPRINARTETLTLQVGEEDVNWAINAYERQKKLFNQNVLLQYMPFIALGFVSIIILIIFIYFFKEFKTLKEMGVALKDTATILAQAKGVIP